jgi:organic hydroperoxide reductase OsmC/OhrA
LSHTHTATIAWERHGAPFSDQRYGRGHHWTFDGGARIIASSSPLVVPPPMSDPSAVDPEEAFVAALSSCHMLFFLSLAARDGFVVERYEDEAIGTVEPDARGRQAITSVTLHPRVEFHGSDPDPAIVQRLHHRAHELCYIANSVTSEVMVRPRNGAPLPDEDC